MCAVSCCPVEVTVEERGGELARKRLGARPSPVDPGPCHQAKPRGLVRSHRRGRERIWELEPKRLAQAHEYLDRISSQWDDALERLKKFVER